MLATATMAPAMTAPAMSGIAPYRPMGVPDGVEVVVAADPVEIKEGIDLSQLRDWFNAYQDVKQPEMDEQREARRYYHGKQWTEGELKKLEERNQPPITDNRVGPKIDGIVGVIVRLRQDPKAYPRTQAHAAGADIGTAAVREVFDEVGWEALHAQVAQDLAIDGLGGVELDLDTVQDSAPIMLDRPQPANITFRRVAPETFFYDPRSVRADFSDARYMGVYKWMDLDAAIELMPDQEEALRQAIDLTDNVQNGLEDWDKLWYDKRLDRVKVVECWYRRRSEWRGAIFSGSVVMSDVVSPFRDDRGKTIPRYVMTSSGIDHEGNRYGFVRNMSPSQDEINHRRSAFLHGLNVEQVIYEDGVIDDINTFMDQLARRDSAVKVKPGALANNKIEIRNRAVQMQGQFELLNEAKQNIENFGPSPALLGSAGASASGRAIQLQQQAGIAQLGPYFTRYKDWKLRLYRAVWAGIKDYWTNERFIRVAGQEPIQFLPINQMVMTPTGPRIANAIGQLNLDIVMDEGPDVVTMQEDVMMVVKELIQQQLLPREAALPLVLELVNLPPNDKARLMNAGREQQSPEAAAEQQQVKQLQFAGAVAKVRETNARADSAQADAIHKVAQAKNSTTLSDEHVVHTAKALNDIEHTTARTRKIHAEADAATLGNLSTLGDGVAAAMRTDHPLNQGVAAPMQYAPPVASPQPQMGPLGQ